MRLMEKFPVAGGGEKVRNESALFELFLREDSAFSRVELAEISGYDAATVTRTVRSLVLRGLLIPGGKSAGSSGRPREKLHFNHRRAMVIGIARDATTIIGLLSTLNGEIVHQERVEFVPGRRNDPGEALERIVRLLFIAAWHSSVVGVGIARYNNRFSESVGEERGAFEFPQNFNLSLFFQERCRIAPVIIGRAVAGVREEVRRVPRLRRGRGMLFSLGCGLGCVPTFNGDSVAGLELTSEFGHSICEPAGIVCECGRRGCLVTRCSLSALRREIGAELSVAEIAALCDAGDPVASRAVEEAGRFLGTAIANQVNGFAPETVVVSGPMIELGPRFINTLRRRLDELIFNGPEAEAIVIHAADTVDYARGAALQAVHELLEDPERFVAAFPMDPVN